MLNPTSPSVPGPLWAYFKCQTNRKRVLRADDTRSVSTVSASSDGTALQQSHLVVVQSHVELGHSVVHIHSLLVMGWRSLHPLPCTYFPSTLVSCSLCSRIILQLSSFMTCCDFSISSFEVSHYRPVRSNHDPQLREVGLAVCSAGGSPGMKNKFPFWVNAPNFEVSSQIKATARAQRKRELQDRPNRTEGQQICSRYADESNF